MTIPYIIEQGPNNQERAYDLYSRLLKDRIVFIKGGMGSGFADPVVGQLLFLESDSSEKDIYMYINSPGGLLDEMYAVYDVMQYIKPDITTVAYGKCMSAGSFLLAAGAKGKRYTLPHSEVMIHQPLGGTEGQATDIAIHAQHIVQTKELLNEMISKHTGKDIKQVEEDTERDKFMTAKEALDYGILDRIIESKK